MTTAGDDEAKEVTIDGDIAQEVTHGGDLVYARPSISGMQLEGYDDTWADLSFSADIGTLSECNVWGQYRQSGSSSWDYKSPATTAGSDGRYTVNFTGLEPQTEYEFRGQIWGPNDNYKLGETSIGTLTTNASITFVDDVASTNHADAYMDYSSSDPSQFNKSTAWGDHTSESYEVVPTDGSAAQMHSVPEDSGWNSYQNSFLPYYPQPGDTIHVRFRIPHSHDGSYQGSDVNLRFRWGVNGISDRYGVMVSPNLGNSPVYLYDYYGSSGSIDSAQMNPYDANAVFDFVIDWASDGRSATVDVVEVATGTVHCTVSGSLGSHAANGIGWRWTDGSSGRSLVDAVWVE